MKMNPRRFAYPSAHRYIALLGVPVLALFSTLAAAHPGHGIIEGWAHFLTAEHVVPPLVALGVLLFAIFRRNKDRS